MLRFVYIGEQISKGEKEFAFYDTVRDRFVELAGIQVFAKWDIFASFFKIVEDSYPQYNLDRFWKITPESIRGSNEPTR